MRFRHLFLFLGSAIVLTALFATDPDKGLSTGMVILGLAATVIAVALAHIARKALMDYPEADMQELFRNAGGSPIGSGLALVAMAIIISALLGLFGRGVHAQEVGTYIPPLAHTYLPTLQAERSRFWPDHPRPAVLAALVEHESCVTLRSTRCWNPASQLKTSREEGAGLGQITRAYRADGTERFDALSEMRQAHPALADLTWANVYRRPDLQLRAVVLKSRNDYLELSRVVTDREAALAFADASYNGGLAGVQRERRACSVTPGCDPQKWFGNVAAHCLKSHAALYGQRSACDINRHHVQDVILTRSPKYQGLI